jgi:hypothetical protein
MGDGASMRRHLEDGVSSLAMSGAHHSYMRCMMWDLAT